MCLAFLQLCLAVWYLRDCSNSTRFWQGFVNFLVAAIVVDRVATNHRSARRLVQRPKNDARTLEPRDIIPFDQKPINIVQDGNACSSSVPILGGKMAVLNTELIQDRGVRTGWHVNAMAVRLVDNGVRDVDKRRLVGGVGVDLNPIRSAIESTVYRDAISACHEDAWTSGSGLDVEPRLAVNQVRDSHIQREPRPFRVRIIPGQRVHVDIIQDRRTDACH